MSPDDGTFLRNDGGEIRTPVQRCLAFLAAMPSLRDVVDQILAVAGSDLAVLVTGETGTGKELVARAVHEASSVSEGPFIAVNGGAIASGVFESEMFGHERGSFTSAVHAHRGVWGRAAGGSLFLDEAGELDKKGQTALLRVMESGEYTPVGGETVERARVRLITATNLDLLRMINVGSFRRDLFYRINHVVVRLPPLRTRIGTDLDVLLDVVLGSKHMLTKAARQRLIEHSWPGNVRELMNVMKAAVVFSGNGVIDARHIVFPEEAWSHEVGEVRRDEHGPETVRVLKLGEACKWDRAEAAKMLGMSQSSLSRLLKRLGLREMWRRRQGAARILTPALEVE